MLWLLLGLAPAQNVLEVPGQFATVRHAVEAAFPGDIIEIDAQAGFQRDLIADVIVTKDLTFRGVNGRPTLPRLDIFLADVLIENVRVMGVDRPFDEIGVDTGLAIGFGNLELLDVDLLPTDNGTGVFATGSTVRLERVTADSFYGPGAVVAVIVGSLDVIDSTFTNNMDGALEAAQAPVMVSGSTFIGNAGYSGGDIAVVNTELQPLSVDNSTFTWSGGGTGAAISGGVVDMSVTNSSFTDGWSYEGGGAILFYGQGDNPGTLHIDNSQFIRNWGLLSAGALSVSNVQGGLIENSTFTANIAGEGGSISFAGGDLTVRSTDFTESAATFNGGAILALTDPYEGLYNTTLTIEDSTLTGLAGGRDAFSGGCLSIYDQVDLTVRNTLFQDCESDWNGGAIAATDSTMLIEGSTFKDNVSWLGAGVDALRTDTELSGNLMFGNHGGLGSAVSIDDAGVVMTWNWITDNTADDTGAVDLFQVDSAVIENNRLCRNVSTTAGATVTLLASAGEPFKVKNNVLAFNSSDLGTALWYGTWEFGGNIPQVKVHNNDFVRNDVAAAAATASAGIDFRNNIVADHPIGIVSEGGLDGRTGDYNLWFMNGSDAEGIDNALPGPGAVVEQDPLFQGLIDQDCNSNLWLQSDSPARDAGDPTILDSDGSRSDIGAYGGPGSDLWDGDGDGWAEDLDCDDDDPLIHPGMPEVLYDGWDQDCDGADLCDGDGDGFDSTLCGGRDCNDEDASIHPKAKETPNDDIDQNCDDFEPNTWVAGGSSCGLDHTGGAPTGLWLSALVLLGLRRRR